MNDRLTEAQGSQTRARVRDIAEHALTRMRAHGFEQAQVSASVSRKQEVNIAHNEPSLLRSTDATRVALVGIIEGRKACLELPDIEDAEAFEARLVDLRAEIASAPADDANAVSSAQRASIDQGPQSADRDVLLNAARSLLDFRSRETTKVMVDECSISHLKREFQTLTSEGSDLSGSLGWYEAHLYCVARDGKRVSSFNGAGGAAHSLAGDLADRFGVAETLRSAERQIRPCQIGSPFIGSVVLAPAAVEDLVSWFLGQLGDAQLIARSSLYQGKPGQVVASPLLTLKSCFDAPGVAAVSADAFATPPVDVLVAGKLNCLLPSLYGSRKTGIPHVPVPGYGWELLPGTAKRAELIAGVSKGALVGRLSMGRPASNGDFSGIIKNSFLIENGRLGEALSETMIGGNVASMLRDVDAVSIERIDFGTTRLPWLRVPGLHFS